MPVEEIGWERFCQDVRTLHVLAESKGWTPAHGVWGVPNGGTYVASQLHRMGWRLWDHPRPGCLIVDDLIDGGETLRSVKAWTDKSVGECGFAAVYRKDRESTQAMEAWSFAACEKGRDEWLAFPWEARPWRKGLPGLGPVDAVQRLIEWTGDDPTREGVLDTPARVCKALREMTAGYGMDPAAILARTFDSADETGQHWNEMVVLAGIRFTSLCEHHMLPFSGTAAVGYVPARDGRIVGISKLARLVECFARRLQVQERLATQVVEAVRQHLKPQGAGVLLKATHGCMTCRGVMQPEAVMATSALRGIILEEEAARAEFLRLAGA